MSEPFDFEAFISGAQLARRTVSAYKIDHRDEIQRLEERHDELRARRSDGHAQRIESGDEREGVAPDRKVADELRKVAERIASLRQEMEGSQIDFVIRTLTPDEFRDITEDPFEQFALQSVEPELTVDQVKTVAERIGAAQWGEMMSAANDIVLSKVAVPDFSPSVSETLSLHKP